ncbi:hypothetical protein [Streptomyces sp. NPDC006785]|uniref:hypothetical protein n=1 Tax=Streptomyces sp. NPDC006785 TaxID=3155461 RepID=UPI0033FF0F83
MQQGPDDAPRKSFRVTWAAADGPATAYAINAPRVDEGALIIKTDPATVLWVPLGAILGPVTIEAI